MSAVKLDGVLRQQRAKPGTVFVADEIAVIQLCREAHRRQILGYPNPGEPDHDAPDVVARIGNVPVIVRCRVPVGCVYVVQPSVVPAPSRDDRDLALALVSEVDRIIKQG